MNVNQFLKRWVMRYINRIYFYLPWDGGLSDTTAILRIKPLSCIWAGSYATDKSGTYLKLFFYPECDKWQETGQIEVNEGYRLNTDAKNITKGCNYRLYKKVEEEYIAVKPDGTLDEQDETPLQCNTVQYTLPIGEYYYKEYIAGEGDELEFKCLKLIVLLKDNIFNKTVNVIPDYTDDLLLALNPKIFILYEVQDGTMHETFPEYITYLDELVEEEEQKLVYFNWEIKHLPRLVRTYVTFEEKVEEYIHKLIGPTDWLNRGQSFGPGWWIIGPVGAEGQLDKIEKNNLHKIIPKFKEATYMGTSFNSIEEKDILNDQENNTTTLYYNLYHFEGRGFWATTYLFYKYSNHLEIKPAEVKANKAISFSKIPCLEGYIASWEDYETKNVKLTDVPFGHLYKAEEYRRSSSPAQPGGNWIINSGVVCSTNDTYDISYSYDGPGYSTEGQVVHSGFTPDKAKMEPDKKLNDTIFNFKLYTPKLMGLTNFKSTDGMPLKPGFEETRISVINPTYSAGYASAEDTAVIPNWIAKPITKDRDNPNGFTAPGGGMVVPQYYRVTIYENEKRDNVCEYKFKTYYETTDVENLYFWNENLYSRKAATYGNVAAHEEYPHMEEVKDFDWGCGAVVVITRQSRLGYMEWKKEAELFESKNNYTIDYDSAVLEQALSDAAAELS